MADLAYDESVVNESCARAPLNPRWVFKLGVIALVVLIVGIWGFWDATSVYPNRGKRYADWAQWQYLEQAKKADSEEFGVFLRDSSVPNPAAELAALQQRHAQNQADAVNPSSTSNLRASMKLARQNWLEALEVVGMLNSEHTTIDSPQQRLDELTAKWQSASAIPKPLHTLDLMVQWLIMGVCLLVALLMVVHMFRVRSRRYSWDAPSMTLTIPSGANITPDDLEEVDKRKWDKFIVFLGIKPGHAQLGGQEVKVDTYQRRRVEDWILAMEAQAFPSQETGDDTRESTTDDRSEPETTQETQQEPAPEPDAGPGGHKDDA